MSPLHPDQWKALSSYLEKALDMTDAERAVWLALLRRESPDLTEQIEELLREHKILSEEGFLDSKSVAMPGVPGLTGQKLGAYTLLSQIGQGGMGSVWLAERNDGRFERKVAVKFLSIALMGKGGEERFRQEGNILGGLTHPHIASLLDSGVTTAGQPYLVLEYVEGEQIDRYSDQRALDIRMRIILFLDMLSAVSHAHRNLVVHRDIKPSNVFVTKRGEVKLLDFGIAKLMADEGGAASTLLTRDGVIPMTPEYAAPEQLQGDTVTTLTDVYVLGVLLYLLLTGQHPSGANPQSPAELVKAIIDKEPTRPSDVVAQTDLNTPITIVNAARRSTTPDRLSRDLQGDLDIIVAKALKKDPAERYGSVTSFAEDLRRYLRNQPIHARPDTFLYRATKFVRRNRAATALAGLVFVATAAGAVGTYTQSRSARAQCNLAMQQLRRKQALSEFNSFLLSDAAPAGKPFTVNELLERAELVLSRQHANDDADRVELLVSIGDQYSTQDDDVKARRVLEEAYRVSQVLPKGPTRAEAACALAGALARDGNLPRAETLFQEGVNQLTAETDYDQERIFCLRRGSEVAQERGDAKQGVERMETAQQILKASPFHSELLELSVSMDLAEAYRMAGDNQRAVEKFMEASRLVSSLGRENTQNAVVLYNDWGLALYRLGRPVEAERLFVRALAVSRSGKTNDGVSPMVLKNYAAVLRELGRLNDAASVAERALARAKQVDNHVVIYQAEYLLSLIYLDQGKSNRVTVMLRDLEPRLHQTFTGESFWFGALASAKGLLAANRGKYRDAIRLADESISKTEAVIQHGGEGVDYLPILLLRSSSIKLQAGQNEQAVADADRAISMLEKSTAPGTFSSYLGKAQLARARALQAAGKQHEAQLALNLANEQLLNTLGADNPDVQRARQLATVSASRRSSSRRA